MTEVQLPLTKMIVTRGYTRDKRELESEVLEGEVPMTQANQDAYKAIVGDGQAKVTVSRELSEGNYGSGGKAFVAITLTCDQSQQGLQAGTAYAKSLVDYYVEEHFKEVRQKCYDLRILQAPNNP